MNFLFELYKNKPLNNSGKFKKEIKNNYSLNDKEISELYIKLVNYQVKTYGRTLDVFVPINSFDKNVLINSKSRKRAKRLNLGLRKEI